MRAAGVTDKAIEEAIHVSALFNMMDRIADALDFEVATPAEAVKTARVLLRMGYKTGALPG